MQEIFEKQKDWRPSSPLTNTILRNGLNSILHIHFYFHFEEKKKQWLIHIPYSLFPIDHAPSIRLEVEIRK